MKSRGTPRLLHLSASKMRWLLLALGAIIAPHLLHVPFWIGLGAALTAGWALLASRNNWRPPGRLLRFALVLAAATAVHLHFGTVLGRDAGVALVVLLAALKLLELHDRRDVMLLGFLGYFLVVTNFLYSQSVPMALYMAAAVLLLTSALVAASDPQPRLRPLARLRTAGVLLAQALPVMVMLFVLFPRIPGPLWQLPKDAHGAVTGLGDTMSPGTINRLIRSSQVAFRVEFEGAAPERRQLYWRGPVLWHYDGRTWRRPPAPLPEGSGPPGRQVEQEITLEPHNQRWLFALDVPQTAPEGAGLTPDGQLLARAPVTERVRYRVRSALVGDALQRLPAAARHAALQLPLGLNPRTRALAAELRAAASDDRALIRAALGLFRDRPFVYTLEPPGLGLHAMDEFLFETRRGFCEHYASAFVYLMRAAGVPARVVTGYQGAEYNPIGDYWIVRQSDAHAWAEVWLPGAGWRRVDPTAAVSPERIETGLEGALADELDARALSRSPAPWLRQVARLWDSLNNDWNQWVLGYGTGRQLRLLQHFGLKDVSWQKLAVLSLAAVTGVLAVLGLGTLLRHRSPRPDPVVRCYQLFCSKLGRTGMPRRPGEGPLAFARRVARERPDLAASAGRIAHLYAALRYGPRPPADQAAKLCRLVQRFSPDERG